MLLAHGQDRHWLYWLWLCLDSRGTMSMRKAGRILQVSAQEQFGTSVSYSKLYIALYCLEWGRIVWIFDKCRYSIFICTVWRTAGIKIYWGSMEGWSTVMRMSFHEWWIANYLQWPRSLWCSCHTVVGQFCSWTYFDQNMVSIQESSLSGSKKTNNVFFRGAGEPVCFCCRVSIH